MLGKGVSGPPVPHTNVGGGSCGGGDKGGSCVGVEGRIKGGGWALRSGVELLLRDESDQPHKSDKSDHLVLQEHPF